MSIIQQIRERGAVAVIALIALSLIGFILMDSGRGAGSGGMTPADAIASVNGTKISYEQFLDLTKQYEDYYASQGRPKDDANTQQIYSEAYQNLVDGELINQELAKLGLAVTPKEFDDMLYGKNPAEFLRREFTDPNTGVFDAARARQAMNQLKKGANNENKQLVETQYLKPLMEGGIRNKYFALVQNSLYYPKWLLEKTIADNNTAANLEYVMVPYSSIVDSTIKVTDAEILAFAQKRKAEYETKEKGRSIAYVAYNFLPTAADSAEVLAQVNNLKAEFISTNDPGAFVDRNGSSLKFYNGYNSKERIQIPNKDSILGTGIGNVYGPYVDGNNYVLSRVVDIKSMPDSVKARHILISATGVDSAAKKQADSLLAAIKGGSNFEALATQFSADQGSKIKGGDLGYFAGGMMVPEFNDFCFNGKTGDLGIVQTQYGYHIIQVTDQKNFLPSYKVAYLAKVIEPSGNTINDAMNAANVFASKASNLKKFDEVLKTDKLNRLVATDILENSFQITGIGANRNLVREIFKADVGDVLEPIQLTDQFVVVAVTDEQAAGIPKAEKLRPMVESMVRNEKKGVLITDRIGQPKSLEELATKEKTTVLRADSVSFSSPMVGTSGFEPKVGGYVVGKAAANKVSPAIAGVNGVFVVKPTAQYALANAGLTADNLKQGLIQQQRNSVIYGSIQALRNAANVKDRRSKFL